jgi:molybdate transport system substrate-binding protein
LFSLGTAAPIRAADTRETAPPPHVAIAAAANLVYALDELNAAFKADHANAATVVTIGASGSLVAQIAQGAPCDVFLSADLDYPQKLVAAGQADASSLTTFAVGRLVLWTTNPAIALDSIAEVVRRPAVKKIAMANHDTAPYGRAAQETLEKLGAWTDARPKLVIGENITQTAQFVATGNADAGFVALSLVLSPKLKERGRWLEVPGELHTPLAQGAVLTTRGAKNPAAKMYLEFLRSDTARAILQRYGYALPAK